MTPFWFLVSGLTMFKKWPAVEFGQIYVYLIDSPGSYTWETMKAYSSLEAYQQFFNGWMRTCYLLEVSNTLLLKAKVMRSQAPAQALTDTPHEASCAFDKLDATVLTVHHTCMAGEHSIYFTLTNQQWHISAYSKEICSVWLSCTVMTVLPSQY